MTHITITPLTHPHEARQSAAIMAASDPWQTLGRNQQSCFETITNPNREAYLGWFGTRLAGLAVIELHGAFVGYLKAICIDPELRGQGIGTALLDYIEARILREMPNVFLCVSGFNQHAKRLYERRGYWVIGELTDYVISGQSELLMRKTIGPIDTLHGRLASRPNPDPRTSDRP